MESRSEVAPDELDGPAELWREEADEYLHERTNEPAADGTGTCQRVDILRSKRIFG